MSAYLGNAVLLYLQALIDWESYFTWRKGESSGHHQRVTEIRIDCDADTILMQVEQTGAACHEGYESCFFRRVESDSSVNVADPRLVDPKSVYKNQ